MLHPHPQGQGHQGRHDGHLGSHPALICVKQIQAAQKFKSKSMEIFFSFKEDYRENKADNPIIFFKWEAKLRHIVSLSGKY